MTRLRTAALVGNPNSGKSALFNALTGARQKIANYPGVTVERKAGRMVLPSGEPVELVDLPGSYALDAASPDEEVTRDTLHEVVKPWRLNGGVRPYKAVGCLECRMTGYRGRAGLFELLTVSDAARNFIQPACNEGKLRAQALQDGLRPLRLAGAMKVAEGVTTLDEVLRATPAWEQ